VLFAECRGWRLIAGFALLALLLPAPVFWHCSCSCSCLCLSLSVSHALDTTSTYSFYVSLLWWFDCGFEAHLLV
jgi:hypothetical protein